MEQAQAKPPAAKTDPKTSAKGGAQATAVATVRPYLESSQRIVATLEPAYDKRLQYREKRNEIAQLKEILEERKRALQEVQAVQKTEQQATGTLDAQIL